MTAEEIAAAMGGEGTPNPVEIPEEILEGVKTSDLDVVFQEKFGVKIADIPTYAEYKNKYEELNQGYTQLKAQSEIDPFSNPVSRKVNEMFAAGATTEEVNNYISIQSIDFSKMTPEELVMRKMGMDLKGVSKDSIKKHFEETYYKDIVTTDDDGEEKKERQLLSHKLEIDSVKAKQFLESQKVELSNPQALAKKEAAEAKAAELGQKWGTVTKAILGSVKKIPLNLKDEEKGIDYSFEYAVPEDNLKQIEAMLIQNAINGGLELTKENAQLLRNQAIQAYKISHFDDFVNNLVRDVYAKSTEKAILDAANGGGKPTGSAGGKGGNKIPKLVRREGFY